MERDTNQMSQSPSLCRSGCGFYGSPKTDGLCSKCYKDALKRKQANPAPPPITGRTSPTVTTVATTAVPSPSEDNAEKPILPKDDDLSTASPTVPAVIVTPPSQEQCKQEGSKQNDKDSETSTASPATSKTTEEESLQDESLEKDQKKKKNRCHICRKRVGLTGFPCRCGGLFCSLHRYSNEHNCTFDYKQLGAQEIRKNNPLVVGEKVKKI